MWWMGVRWLAPENFIGYSPFRTSKNAVLWKLKAGKLLFASEKSRFLFQETAFYAWPMVIWVVPCIILRYRRNYSWKFNALFSVCQTLHLRLSSRQNSNWATLQAKWVKIGVHRFAPGNFSRLYTSLLRKTALCARLRRRHELHKSFPVIFLDTEGREIGL